jgi:hypothetical protein
MKAPTLLGDPSQTGVTALYSTVWRLSLAMLAFLVAMSDVARAAVVVPLLATSLLLVSRFGEVLRGRRVVVGAVVLGALILITVDRALSFSGVGDLPGAGVEVLSGFLILSLLNIDRPRAFWFATLTCAVIAIGSVSFSDSLFVYGTFVVYLGVLMFGMNAAYLRFGDGAPHASALPPRYLRQFVFVMPAGIAVAFVVFLAFPRVQSISMFLGSIVGGNQTGYSGAVSLEGDGQIEMSTELAFIVEADKPGWLAVNGPKMLFRGDALDEFDGMHWRVGAHERRLRYQVRDSRVSRVYSRDPHTLTFYLEPRPQPAVFYPGVLLKIQENPGLEGDVMLNAIGSATREPAVAERFVYTAIVAEGPKPEAAGEVSIADLRQRIGETLAPRAGKGDGELPPPFLMNADDRRVAVEILPEIRDADWFQGWIRETGVTETDSLAAAAAKLMAHFDGTFTASMANAFSDKNTLKSFLTVERAAHCEFFATASALLFRSFGIPARVVVGYRGGAWNDFIDALEVREGSAHAWIEVYAPTVGWVTLDPTPAVEGGAALSSPWLDRWRQVTTATSFFLRRYVVDYDLKAQRDLLTSIRGLANSAETREVNLKEIVRGGLIPLLSILGLLIVLTMLARWRFEDRASQLPRYYQSFERQLARFGWQRRRHESLAEFHARLLERGFPRDLIEPMATAVEQDLYGRAPAATKRRELARITREVRRAARDLRPPKSAGDGAETKRAA